MTQARRLAVLALALGASSFGCAWRADSRSVREPDVVMPTEGRRVSVRVVDARSAEEEARGGTQAGLLDGSLAAWLTRDVVAFLRSNGFRADAESLPDAELLVTVHVEDFLVSDDPGEDSRAAVALSGWDSTLACDVLRTEFAESAPVASTRAESSEALYDDVVQGLRQRLAAARPDDAHCVGIQEGLDIELVGVRPRDIELSVDDKRVETKRLTHLVLDRGTHKIVALHGRERIEREVTLGAEAQRLRLVIDPVRLDRPKTTPPRPASAESAKTWVQAGVVGLVAGGLVTLRLPEAEGRGVFVQGARLLPGLPGQAHGGGRRRPCGSHSAK